MKKITTIILLTIACFTSCKESVNEKVKTLANAIPDTELEQKTAAELRLIRNEVFARKGYVFKSKDLNTHFKGQAWYSPNPDTLVELNSEEKAYVDKIKDFEQKLKEKEVSGTYEKAVTSTDTLVNSNGQISYQGMIDTTYVFADNYGAHSILLTNAEDNKSIYAYCSLKDETNPKLLWKLRDFVSNEQEGVENEIAFIKPFINIKDLDEDGLVDPILVYATEGDHSFDEGRLKIVIRYKNSKIVIRHKNTVLEEERETEIEEAFFELPVQIKSRVKEIMIDLMENKYAVFNNSVLDQIYL